MSRKVPSKKPQPAAPRSRADLWIALALLLATLAIYSQAGSHDFVDYDDRIYVGDNPLVRDGFSWEGVRWALTSLDDSNWFPLTRLSHMLDCQLFGLDAGMHHWTSVMIDALSALLLFAILKRMTGERWPSAFVALAFALHPLHVESVAWIAERKDVLSAFFWFVTIWAYLNYIERPTATRYLLLAGTFLCGLMSKPMVVTLPFALLLLDFWPLRRLTRRAALEKIPLIALSAAVSVVTFIAQKKAGSVAELTRFPVGLRLENVVVSYAVYLKKFIWPEKLAVFYPYPDSFPAWQWILAALALAAVSAATLMERKRRPYLLVGWLWYLGTLVPVIGLIQVGVQTRADRYTYIPLIGISIMIAWLAAEAVEYRRTVAWAGGAVAFIWCALTWQNLENWRNSETLFLHAINSTEKNFVAYNNLGGVRRRQGRFADAVSDFAQAVAIQPANPEGQDNLGEALTTLGRADEAIPHLKEAIRIQPAYAKAHVDLGAALIRSGHAQEAAEQFEEALRVDPENHEAQYNLGGALMAEGRAAEAMPHLERALPFLIDKVRREPSDPDNHFNLGAVYGLVGRFTDAAGEFNAAARLRPDDAEIRLNLGLALASSNQLAPAVEQFSVAIRLRPDYARAHFELGRVFAAMARGSEAAQEFSQAIKLAPDFVAAKQELEKLQKR